MNPKEKRRGGQRDDSTLTVGLNKKELAELLERTRRKCEEYERRQRFAIKDKLLNIKMLRKKKPKSTRSIASGIKSPPEDLTIGKFV